ncbi:MAG: UDP-N-acetylmuramoyl-tripeptide--D-alanyl-D-alanine ligase [Phycisphaeraceae bacterium]|nr:UDP-N-acetylmuramoyl-tripeptide--D-alanyl-D-alanine ligase [Phycisphaeraceae bacterium]
MMCEITPLPIHHPSSIIHQVTVMTDFWTPRRFAQIIAGRWLREPADLDAPLLGASIDSRTIQSMQVFVAIQGEQFDGHDYVEQAISKGATFAIVARALDWPLKRPVRSPEAIPMLLVEDTVKALQLLASAWRKELAAGGCKVIAVTGSNGKTTTRHLIHYLLSARFHGTQSPKSFNNHLGVPLTLLAARADDDFVVAEVGTNHPGEIAPLAEILRPDAAVITTIGLAHIGNFGTRSAIEKEKRSLYDHVAPGGLKVQPDLQPDDALVGRLPLPGAHMRRNAQAAAVVAQWMGLDDVLIAQRLADLPGAPLEGRWQTMRLGRVTVIHDAYNANPDSAIAAIDLLVIQKASRRVLVLGDMRELGEHSAAAHRRVGAHYRKLRESQDLLIAIGTDARLAGGEHTFDAEAADMPTRVAELLREGDLVLLKGSRAMRLERLIPAIEERFRQ